MFLLVPAYPGCPGSKAVKRSLLLLLDSMLLSVYLFIYEIDKMTRSFCGQDGSRTELSVVWAPTQDGGFYALKTELYLPEMPHEMRQQGNFERVPAIIGINAQDGAEVASM